MNDIARTLFQPVCPGLKESKRTQNHFLFLALFPLGFLIPLEISIFHVSMAILSLYEKNSEHPFIPNFHGSFANGADCGHGFGNFY